MNPLPGERSSRESLLDRALHAAFDTRGFRARDADSRPDDTLPPEHVCRVEHEIARGGMGVVYRAVDPGLEREVAVKLLREDLADDPAAVARFCEEARIGGALQHPGIVPVYVFGRTPTGRPWFTMKLIEGRTLASMLASRASPDEDRRRFLSIFESMCRTIAYAHSRGVVHLDLKPGNVMVGAFEEVQVVDWGLAAIVAGSRAGVDPRAGGSRVYGTPAYMPPEQARGELGAVDARADLFALGAILCEILTGNPPYPGGRGASRLDAADARLAGAAERLADCIGSSRLPALAGRCLAADPQMRPASAAEIATAVSDDFASLEARAHAAEIAAVEERVRAAQARRARRLTISLASTIVVSLFLAVGVWTWLARERDLRRTGVELRAGAALEEASRLLGQAESSRDASLYASAALAAERAQAALAGGEGSAELSARAGSMIDRIRSGEAASRERAERERAQKALLARLDALHVPDDDLDYPGSPLERDRAYSDAFRAGGLAPDALSPADFAQAAQARGIQVDVAAALDDWSDVREAACLLRGADALRELALLVDPDPLRTSVRHAIARGGQTDLQAILDHQDLSHLRPQTFHSLGRALAARGPAPAPGPEVRLYRMALRAHPSEYTIAVELAHRLFAAGREHHDEGEHVYRLAQALRPQCVTPYLDLGWELEHLEIDPAAAAELERRAVELQPSWGLSYFCLGRSLRSIGDLDGASAAQHAAARLMPGDGRPHKELALLHRLAGRTDEAIEELRATLQDNPWYGVARIELATLLSEVGRTDEALAELRQALEYEPGSRIGAQRIEASFRLAGGDYEGAAPLLARALDVDADLEALLPLHDQGLRLQDFAELEPLQARCEEAVARTPALPEAYCRLGAVLEARGRCAEALVVFRTGRALGGRLPSSQLASERWVARAERLASIERRLPKALAASQEPQNAREAFDLAWIAARTGFPREAARWFARAFELDPALASSRFGRLEAICAAVAAGDHDRALAWLGEEASLLRQQLQAGGPVAIEARIELGALRTTRELQCVRAAPAWHDAWEEIARLGGRDPGR